MTRSRSWISLVYLLVMSVFVTLGGVSSVAYADSQHHLNTTSAHWTPAHVSQAMKTSSRATSEPHSTFLDATLHIPAAKKTQSSTHDYLSVPHGIPIHDKSNAIPGRQHKQFITVHSGDTLWAIARDNSTTVVALMALNNLNSSLIMPGQKLQINGRAHKLTVYQSATPPVQAIDLHVVSHVGIPLQLIPIYMAAGQKYGIPWTVLAAIHRIETDFSTGPEVSGAGAEGPMQFMPTTFEHYGVKAPGHHGTPNINNVYDAIYTAAHMLAADGYANNPAGAIYQYNHSMAYVDSVEMLAQTYQV